MTDDTKVQQASPASTRDQMRAKIFAAKTVKRKTIDFFGTDIEIRQPTLGDIVDAQSNEDRKAAVVETLIKYAYIPKTDTKVFEDGDADVFKGMPFGGDFIRVSKTLEELTEVNFLGPNKDSAKTDSDT